MSFLFQPNVGPQGDLSDLEPYLDPSTFEDLEDDEDEMAQDGLTKFEKGRIQVLQQERVYIQKKTFTKWCNSFLEKVKYEYSLSNMDTRINGPFIAIYVHWSRVSIPENVFPGVVLSLWICKSVCFRTIISAQAVSI